MLAAAHRRRPAALPAPVPRLARPAHAAPRRTTRATLAPLPGTAGQLSLFWACEIGASKFVRMLVDAKAEPDKAEKDPRSGTQLSHPLVVSCLKGHLEYARRLSRLCPRGGDHSAPGTLQGPWPSPHRLSVPPLRTASPHRLSLRDSASPTAPPRQRLRTASPAAAAAERLSVVPLAPLSPRPSTSQVRAAAARGGRFRRPRGPRRHLAAHRRRKGRATRVCRDAPRSWSLALSARERQDCPRARRRSVRALWRSEPFAAGAPRCWSPSLRSPLSPPSRPLRARAAAQRPRPSLPVPPSRPDAVPPSFPASTAASAAAASRRYSSLERVAVAMQRVALSSSASMPAASAAAASAAAAAAAAAAQPQGDGAGADASLASVSETAEALRSATNRCEALLREATQKADEKAAAAMAALLADEEPGGASGKKVSAEGLASPPLPAQALVHSRACTALASFTAAAPCSAPPPLVCTTATRCRPSS